MAKSDMVQVTVRVPARPEFKGYWAAGEFWPEGSTTKSVTKDQLERLQTTAKELGVIAVLAVGADEVAAVAASQKPIVPPAPPPPPPKPGEAGSPAMAPKGASVDAEPEDDVDELPPPPPPKPAHAAPKGAKK